MLVFGVMGGTWLVSVAVGYLTGWGVITCAMVGSVAGLRGAVTTERARGQLIGRRRQLETDSLRLSWRAA